MDVIKTICFGFELNKYLVKEFIDDMTFYTSFGMINIVLPGLSSFSGNRTYLSTNVLLFSEDYFGPRTSTIEHELVHNLVR